jgi:hypothetical protein
MTDNRAKEPDGISRREFLRDTSLLVGGAAIGSAALLAGCNDGDNNKTTKSDLITVLNPAGQPPPIQLVPLAPRLDTMDGKKIYLVDIHFTGTQHFLEDLQKVYQAKYPKSSIILKVKAGAYAENDAALWDEIKKSGDAVAMGVGH